MYLYARQRVCVGVIKRTPIYYYYVLLPLALTAKIEKKTNISLQFFALYSVYSSGPGRFPNIMQYEYNVHTIYVFVRMCVRVRARVNCCVYLRELTAATIATAGKINRTDNKPFVLQRVVMPKCALIIIRRACNNHVSFA